MTRPGPALDAVLAALAVLAIACGSERSSSSPDDDAAADADEELAPREPFVSAEPPLVGSAPLRGDGAPLRRAYLGVRVAIDGDIARTVVTAVLVNDLDRDAEASFRFPLPDDAAVTDFADFPDGRRVRAAVAGKESARAEFERAAAAGERAALAEEDGRSFEMSLAPIPAHGSRRVELSFVQTLEALGGERSYALPAARFESAPPTHLDLELEMVGSRSVTEMTVPSHPEARVTRRSERRMEVHLSLSGRDLGRDFVARWEQPVRDLDLGGRAVRVSADEPGYVETRFAFQRDPSPESRAPIAAVLVVDRSLSMAGEPLARAQELAAEILGDLGPRDSVALVSFAGDVATTDLATADAAHREALERELAGMIARGHSNLPAALDEAATLVAGRDDALVVLMSDGQPTVGDDLDGALPAARAADFGKARVVVAHFNYPTRAPMLEQLFPHAQTRFVPDGDAGDESITQLARLAVAPVLEDFAIEIAGADDATVHGVVPTRLARGDSVRLLARAGADVTVRVTGTLRGEPIAIERRIAMPAAPDSRGDRGLPVEWARARVRELDRRFVAGESELEGEIRELGTSFRLATRFTSFVSTDALSPDRIKPGDPEIRIRAPRSSLAVYGVLPWGEIVACSWDERAGVWVGRFLVPRGTADGLYRLRVFVTEQTGTALRTTLFYRVDSAAPSFELDSEYAAGVLHLRARPVDAVFDESPGGDELRLDLVDLRRLVVRAGDREIELRRAGDDAELWTADLEIALEPGRHELVLTATDYASNSSQTRRVVEVSR